MSILKSVKAGVYSDIEKWLNENGIKKYEIKKNSDKTEDNEPKYTINVENASVNLIGYNEKELPSYIKFGEIIGGDFLCSYGRFTTMKGFSSICS